MLRRRSTKLYLGEEKFDLRGISKARRNFTKRGRDALRLPALAGHEADRLRQSEHQSDDQQQRQRAAEIKDRLPAPAGNKTGANRPAQHGAKGPACGHYRNGHSPPSLRRVFGDEGNNTGSHRAEAEPREETKERQRQEGTSRTRSKREQSKNGSAEDDQRTS